MILLGSKTENGIVSFVKFLAIDMKKKKRKNVVSCVSVVSTISTERCVCVRAPTSHLFKFFFCFFVQTISLLFFFTVFFRYLLRALFVGVLKDMCMRGCIALQIFFETCCFGTQPNIIARFFFIFLFQDD